MDIQPLDDDIKEYLKEELRKEFQRALDESPWWCPMCGEGGNYIGTRPQLYWIPPESHQCKPKKPNLKGITST